MLCFPLWTQMVIIDKQKCRYIFFAANFTERGGERNQHLFYISLTTKHDGYVQNKPGKGIDACWQITVPISQEDDEEWLRRAVDEDEEAARPERKISSQHTSFHDLHRDC